VKHQKLTSDSQGYRPRSCTYSARLRALRPLGDGVKAGNPLLRISAGAAAGGGGGGGGGDGTRV